MPAAARVANVHQHEGTLLMRSRVKPSIAGQPTVPPEIGQLVERLAGRASAVWGRPHADCLEVARVNTFQALVEFNPERGVALASYVAFVVQAALVAEFGSGPIGIDARPDGGMPNLIPARDVVKLLECLDRRPVARDAVARVLGSATSWPIEDSSRKMNRAIPDVARLFAEGVKAARAHHKEGRTPNAVMAARCAITPESTDAEPVGPVAATPAPQLVMVEPPPLGLPAETTPAAVALEAPAASPDESPSTLPALPIETAATPPRARQGGPGGMLSFMFD